MFFNMKINKQKKKETRKRNIITNIFTISLGENNIQFPFSQSITERSHNEKYECWYTYHNFFPTF